MNGVNWRLLLSTSRFPADTMAAGMQESEGGRREPSVLLLLGTRNNERKSRGCRSLVRERERERERSLLEITKGRSAAAAGGCWQSQRHESRSVGKRPLASDVENRC